MSRVSLVLLIAAGALCSARADAASFSIRPSVHIAPRTEVANMSPLNPVLPVTTARPPCHYGCGGPPAPAVYPQYPRYTVFSTNDPFDTAGNLNPGGGGGGGLKPGKKPNAQ